MNVVCDTNVLISGVLFDGPCRRILTLASRGHVRNHISADIILEAEDVLARPKFRLRPEQVVTIVSLFKDTFELVIPRDRVTTITIDPTDNKILEAALACRADAIISGDKHLLQLKRWRGIPILSPARFLEILSNG